MTLERVPRTVPAIEAVDIRVDYLESDRPRKLIQGEFMGVDRTGGYEVSTVLITGRMSLHYFTAERTETISNIEMYNDLGSTLVTLMRLGIYAIDSIGDATLIGATANDVNLFKAAGVYQRAFTSPFQKIKGNRYALGCLCLTTGVAPSMYHRRTGALPGIELLWNRPPRINGAVDGLTDLPSSFLEANVIGHRAFYSARIY